MQTSGRRVERREKRHERLHGLGLSPWKDGDVITWDSSGSAVGDQVGTDYAGVQTRHPGGNAEKTPGYAVLELSNRSWLEMCISESPGHN